MPARRQQLDGDDEIAPRERVRHPRLRVAIDRPGLGRDPRLDALGDRPLLRRRQRFDRRFDLPDVIRRRPAAAADDLRAVQDEPAGVRRHVLGRTQIDVPPFDVARFPGIGLGGQPCVRRARHPLDRLEHGRGADAAVEADDLRPGLDQRRRELFRRRPVKAVPVVFGRHLGDDRKLTDAADRADGGLDLVQVAEGLEDEQLDPALDERLGLLAEVLLGLVHAGLPPGLDANPERSDRSGDIRLLARGVPGDARPLHVDRVGAIREAEGAELDAVGAEGVRLDDVGPGADVGLVHLGDEIRLRQVQLVERPVQEDALGVQHRPHGAVADEDSRVDGLEERSQGHKALIVLLSAHPAFALELRRGRLSFLRASARQASAFALLLDRLGESPYIPSWSRRAAWARTPTCFREPSTC